MSSPIYFDNAASTHPKPEQVYLAADRLFRQGGSPGRAAHELALLAARAVFETRLKVAQFLEVDKPERLIFTPGCTYSINMVLQRFPFERGDLVLVSALEHNAVMRALTAIVKTTGIVVEQVPYSAGEILNPALLQELLKRQRPRLCVFMEASNVTGEKIALELVASICKNAEVPLLVDAAQSAGLFHASLKNKGISFWSTSAHKGLLGAPGLGLLYVAEDQQLAPLISGGTGSFSEGLEMPPAFPDRLEAGTMNSPAIAALGAGCDFVIEKGRQNLAAHELALCNQFLDFLAQESKIECFSPRAAERVPVVSFRLVGIDSGRVAELLDRDFQICVRAGLHCAASAHKTLGTTSGGLIRASFGSFNTALEVDRLCAALRRLAASG